MHVLAESNLMEITELLQAAASGDDTAHRRLYQKLYAQLHDIALGHRLGWHRDDTLNTTALINEAWLKLAEGATPVWESRGHFLAVASSAMRQILVDKSRRRRSLKRGADAPHTVLDEISLADEEAVSPELAGDILRVHEALEKLARTHPRQARVIECRFFGGLQVDEISSTLGISISTIRRDWELGKLWLHRELGRSR
jgi:RNA polymerase sigma factor (TIGR02999 family)